MRLFGNFKQIKWNYDNPRDFIRIELLAFIGRFATLKYFCKVVVKFWPKC